MLILCEVLSFFFFFFFFLEKSFSEEWNEVARNTIFFCSDGDCISRILFDLDLCGYEFVFVFVFESLFVVIYNILVTFSLFFCRRKRRRSWYDKIRLARPFSIMCISRGKLFLLVSNKDMELFTINQVHKGLIHRILTCHFQSTAIPYFPFHYSKRFRNEF